MTQVSDLDWLLLREAVPSFAERWQIELNEPNYDPRLVAGNVSVFTQHVSKCAAAGNWAEFPALFGAIEELYTRAEAHEHPELDTFLTIALLEGLIYSFEYRGLDPRPLARFATGPRTRAGWQAAYGYIHPER